MVSSPTSPTANWDDLGDKHAAGSGDLRRACMPSRSGVVPPPCLAEQAGCADGQEKQIARCRSGRGQEALHGPGTYSHVSSYYLARIVEPRRVGEERTRYVQGRVHAFPIQEAMRPGHGTIDSHDLTEVIYAGGFCQRSARKIERRITVSRAQKAVRFRSGALVTSHDLTDVIYRKGNGVDRERYIEGNVIAVAEEEAMAGEARVNLIETGNLSRRTNPQDTSIYSPGYIERGVVAAITEEAPVSGGRVKVESHYLPRITHAIGSGTGRTGDIEARIGAATQEEGMKSGSQGLLIGPDNLAGIINAIGRSTGRTGHFERREGVVGMRASDRAGQQAQRHESAQEWFHRRVPPCQFG